MVDVTTLREFLLVEFLEYDQISFDSNKMLVYRDDCLIATVEIESYTQELVVNWINK